MEGWRDGCRDLEDLLGGLEDQGWCMACGVYGHTVAICPFQGEEEEEEPAQERKEREEQGTPQSPPPAGGGRLLLPPPQPQLQQRPEDPENLFPWCTWCGEVDHRWRDCSEVPPSWCGRCEEGGHDWSGCPYASSPVPKREEPERPQPKEEEVGASIALGPKLPAEGECLLVPPPPAEEQCLLSPCPPAEEECLLVSPSEAEPHKSPARETELHQSLQERQSSTSPLQKGETTRCSHLHRQETTRCSHLHRQETTRCSHLHCFRPKSQKGRSYRLHPLKIFGGEKGRMLVSPSSPYSCC
ncbi:UNVERIFIED_CONTAM: hypothetical protein FKN15_071755 [Acipenser sinensis]